MAESVDQMLARFEREERQRKIDLALRRSSGWLQIQAMIGRFWVGQMAFGSLEVAAGMQVEMDKCGAKCLEAIDEADRLIKESP